MEQKDIPFNRSSHNPITTYTEVKPSNIHGVGLFVKKKIPKGEIWWHARPIDILIVKKDEFLILNESIKVPLMESFMKALLTYSYYERNLDALIFCLDNSRYVNHSFHANSGASEDENGFMSVALRDILPGEEITEDYSKYTPCTWLKNYIQYFDPRCW